MERIDLNPLRPCKELRRVGLAMNAIEEIDLSPLANAKKLTALDIAGNRISSIDLTPLSKCKVLAELYLHSDHPIENEIKEIDISPLFKCEELEDIGIGKSSIIKVKASLEDSVDIPLAIEELIEADRITWV